jgi:hypothetical protein
MSPFTKAAIDLTPKVVPVTMRIAGDKRSFPDVITEWIMGLASEISVAGGVILLLPHMVDGQQSVV